MQAAAPPRGPASLGEQPPDPKNPKAWDFKTAEDLLDAALADATDRIRPGEPDCNKDRSPDRDIDQTRDRDRDGDDDRPRDRDVDRDRDPSRSRNCERDGDRDRERESGIIARRRSRSRDRDRDRRSRSRRGDRDRSRRGDRDRNRRSRSRSRHHNRSRRDRRSKDFDRNRGFLDGRVNMPSVSPARAAIVPVGLPQGFRAGDWMCPKCNFHNYRGRPNCGQCDASMPTQGSTTGGSAKAERKTKWDEGDKEDVPDWLVDIVPKEPTEVKPPPGVDDQYFRVITLQGRQVRALIGRGGETIRDIRLRSGARVEINSTKQEWEGKVHIVGDVEKALGMIKEALTSQGCPLGKPVKPPGGWGTSGPPKPDPTEEEQQKTGPGGIPLAEVLKNALQEIKTNADGDVEVPADLVAPLIGPGGQTIKEIRDQAGGACFISVLPNTTPGGMQAVRCMGENRDKAKVLVIAKIEEIKLERAAAAVRSSSGGVVRPPKPAGWVGPGAAGDEWNKPKADPMLAQSLQLAAPKREWTGSGATWSNASDFFSGASGGAFSSNVGGYTGGGFSSSPPPVVAPAPRPLLAGGLPTTVQFALTRK